MHTNFKTRSNNLYAKFVCLMSLPGQIKNLFGPKIYISHNITYQEVKNRFSLYVFASWAYVIFNILTSQKKDVIDLKFLRLGNMNGNSPKIFCPLFIIWSNLNSCVSDLSSQQSYALVAILWRRKKITRRWGVPESNLGLISPKAGNQATELYWHSTVNHQDSKKKKNR